MQPIQPTAANPAITGRVSALLIAMLWGLNWSAVKIALGDFAPWTLRTLGLTTAGLLLIAIAGVRGRSLSVPSDQRWRVVIAGLLNIAGFNLFTTFAQLAGSTSRATIIAYTMPMWAVLFAWLVLGERPDRRRAAAIGLGAAGLACLAVPPIMDAGLGIGAWFSLAAGASWAAGTVFLKRWPIEGEPMAVAGWQLLIGAAIAAAGMALNEPWPQLSSIGATAWLAFAFHVLLAIALGYVLWFEVVARQPAGVAALGTLMVPVVALAGAMTLLGERPSGPDLAGFALIVAAAWTALAPRKEPPP